MICVLGVNIVWFVELRTKPFKRQMKGFWYSMVNGTKYSVHCLEYSKNYLGKYLPLRLYFHNFLSIYKNISSAEKSELRNSYMCLYMYLCHLSVHYQHLHCIRSVIKTIEGKLHVSYFVFLSLLNQRMLAIHVQWVLNYLTS